MKKKISNKLLPCPFCGSGAFFDTYDVSDFGGPPRYGMLVMCSNRDCGAMISGTSKKDAVKTWNKRNAVLSARHMKSIKLIFKFDEETDALLSRIKEKATALLKIEEHQETIRLDKASVDSLVRIEKELDARLL